MDLELFDTICHQAKEFTNEIYLHLLGDPLVLSNLQDYLDIAYKYSLKVNITTSGFYLKKEIFTILVHPSIKQVNISLNSFNANKTSKSFDEFIDIIMDFCDFKQKSANNIFINLRLWNIDKTSSAYIYNQKVIQKLKEFFELEHINLSSSKDRQRLANKVIISFDEYFEWPSLNNRYYEEKGFCLGLKSHIAITCSGDVVPCCLDKDAIINLGNLHSQSLKEILYSPKAQAIIYSFKEGFALQELCKHCSFKARFSQKLTT